MATTKVTITDIARMVGVSPATVSYVVNHRQSGFRISQETALKVLNACSQYGYRPDETAVQLYACRNAPLRLLVASPWLYAQFSDFTSQMNFVLREQECSGKIIPTYASYSAGALKECLTATTLRHYEAVLVSGTNAKDDAWLKRHVAELSKVVLMNRRVEGIASCAGNDMEAVQSLTGAVDIQRYGRILSVMSGRHSFCERQRCNGFVLACRKAKREVERLGECRYDELWPVLYEKISSRQEPLLLFVPQYIPAARFLKQAMAAGLRIPEQLGILCYDRHSLLDEFISPRLTTVDPRIGEMTRQCLELLYGVREQAPWVPRTVEAMPVLGETTLNKNLAL